MDARRWLLGAIGVLLVVTFVVTAGLDDLNRRIPLFLSIYTIAFLLYVAAVVVALRVGEKGRGALVIIVLVGAAARLVLVPAQPTMSTDIHRYLWEGHAILHGFNPFAHAPDDPELLFLRGDDYDAINHKDLETIYPPVSQGVFALGALIRPTLSMQKLLFVLFDVGTVLLLIPLLRQRGVDPGASVVYAWSPLVIFETGHSGHLDAVGIFFMVLGLWLVLSSRRAAGFASLALAFLSKYLTAVLVPFFAFRRRHAPWLLVMAGVIVVGYLPFAGAGSKLVSSLQIYSMEWRFNGLVFSVLHGVWDDPLAVRRVLTGLLALFVVFQAFRQTDVLRYAFLTIACALLVVPTLYPWYIAWIVPFLCVYRNRAWILFTGLVFASYVVWPISEQTGQWRLPPIVYAIEYIPFYALLVFDALRGRSRAVAA